MIGLDEAAARLGVTRGELFDWVAAGRLEIFRVGGTLLLRTADITKIK